MPIVLMAKSQVGYINSLDEVGHRPLVGQVFPHQWLARDYPEIPWWRSPPARRLQMVQSGKAFAQVGNLMVLNHYLTTLGMTDVLKVVGITPYTNTFAMAVQKDLFPLASILDKALALIDDGKRASLFQQNLPAWYEWVIPHRLSLAILIGGSVLLVLLMVWIVTLKNQMLRGELAEAQRERSEHRFRTFFENSPTPLMLIDRDGTIIDINRQVHELFGFPA